MMENKQEPPAWLDKWFEVILVSVALILIGSVFVIFGEALR